jgi:hypothetical protein
MLNVRRCVVREVEFGALEAVSRLAKKATIRKAGSG